MTDEMIALARRAVACKGWKWMAGMLAIERDDPQWHISDDGKVRVVAMAPAWSLPDLSDPATLGCLLALVRELRQEPTGFVVPTHAGGWSYYTRLIAADWYEGGTEAEALLAALEAAP